jgi:hypothetical protein
MRSSERTTRMAKKKISPEIRAKLEEIRGELRALRLQLQSKLDATQR